MGSATQAVCSAPEDAKNLKYSLESMTGGFVIHGACWMFVLLLACVRRIGPFKLQRREHSQRSVHAREKDALAEVLDVVRGSNTEITSLRLELHSLRFRNSNNNNNNNNNNSNNISNRSKHHDHLAPFPLSIKGHKPVSRYQL